MFVRDSRIDDSVAIAEIWGYRSSRAQDRAAASSATELAGIIESAEQASHQRLIVAELDGEVVAAAFLSRATVGPFLGEDSVTISYLYVRPGSVRLGAGRALVDAAVTWAEECGAATVMALAGAGDRDANRYFARLGFAAVATVRAAPVSLLRATSFPVEPPVYARTGRRSSRLAGSVLAQRRRQRRLSGQ